MHERAGGSGSNFDCHCSRIVARLMRYVHHVLFVWKRESQGFLGNKLHRFTDMIRQPRGTPVMDVDDGPGQRDSQDALARACHVSGRDLVHGRDMTCE